MNPTGAKAEDLCAKLLSAAGLRVIERNWRCGSEVDLIAEEAGTLCSPKCACRGRGLLRAGESLTAAKRSRLIAAARLYLTGRPQAPCRFDVFLLDGAPASVRWIRNAFGE